MTGPLCRIESATFAPKSVKPALPSHGGAGLTDFGAKVADYMRQSGPVMPGTYDTQAFGQQLCHLSRAIYPTLDGRAAYQQVVQQAAEQPPQSASATETAPRPIVQSKPPTKRPLATAVSDPPPPLPSLPSDASANPDIQALRQQAVTLQADIVVRQSRLADLLAAMPTIAAAPAPALLATDASGSLENPAPTTSTATVASGVRKSAPKKRQEPDDDGDDD